MERDLDFRKLMHMYIVNIWFMILGGIICAACVGALLKGKSESTISKQVYLVYDIEHEENDNLEIKKNIYFDAYQGILKGNVLKSEGVFTEEEKSKLENVSIQVESSCYTISMVVPGNDDLESDKEILDKFVAESEKWMQEKYNDSSFRAEVISDVVSNSNSSVVLKALLGFIVGVILAAGVLFVWFVMDKKMRTENDVKFFTGLECLEVVKGGTKNNMPLNGMRDVLLCSDAKIWGITSVNKMKEKAAISSNFSKSLSKIGKKVLFITFAKAGSDNKQRMLHEISVALSTEKQGTEPGLVEKTFFFENIDEVEESVFDVQFEQFVAACKRDYDYVIIDDFAIEESAAAIRISQLCDENVIVVFKDIEDGIEVRKIVQKLYDLKVKIKGIIFSESKIKRMLLHM